MDYPTTALPFVMPSADQFFSAERIVFAHYFYTFPLSIDNQPSATDYYNRNFLTPQGEKGVHAAYGGYLRSRPLSVPVGPAVSYVQTNMMREVVMALSRGITGFFFDVLSFADAVSVTGHLQNLLKAAYAIDPRFNVVPMLDMNSLGAVTPTQVLQIMQAIQGYASLGRGPDGRILLASYDANLQTLPWWQSVISMLNDNGIYVAFMPILQGSPADAGVYNPISYGVGGWGTAIPSSAATLGLNVASAAAKGLNYVLPVLTQQFRPKSQVFWECENSKAFRNGWMSAINFKSPMIQVVTWSDYSESGQVQPYTDATLDPRIGTGFFDLIAYFAAWYVTGVQPVITQDVLYFFYRKAGSKVARANQPNAFNVAPNEVEINNIELLSFLIAPGTISVNGSTSIVGSGFSVLSVPSTPGIPKFSLSRNGSKVMAFDGPVQIYGPEGLPSGVLDLTYWSGSATTRGITQYSNT